MSIFTNRNNICLLQNNIWNYNLTKCQYLYVKTVLYFPQNDTKEKILGFQNKRLILSSINFLWMGKFAKTQKLG